MSKDDNVAKKPNLLPYGSNVGAPSIKPTDISSWKDEKVVTTNHYFSSRYDEIKKDYLKLMEEYEWNTLVYNAEFRFKPVMGKVYFLYQKDDGKLFLSLIEPNEWDKIFIGAFKLISDNRWEKINHDR
tara:strand:+ start:722 stop:1105 length:384 start_codon:yes stop_codon:yes gene_type:complete